MLADAIRGRSSTLRGIRFRKLLCVLAILAIALSFSGCAKVRARSTPSGSSSASSAESALVSGINGFRKSRGLGPLAVHGNLVNKARSWAGHMANGGCGSRGGVPNICHSTLSNGITVRWAKLAENVGMVSPRTNVSGMHSAFVGSPGHAANMLDRSADYVGVGVAYVGNYMYVAEVFMAT
jgi:uncharacterized protein YkwD